MDTSPFPTLDQVRDAQPGELAVLLSTMQAEDVASAGGPQAEAVVAATQKVASWCHGLQAVAVDRFAELVVDEQEARAAELNAARDAQRAEVEAGGGTWRGGARAVALPEPQQVAASSLAPLLRISPRTMATRLNRARALMELPRTLDLALAGELEPWRVDAVVVAARDVTAARLEEFEARVHAIDVTELPKPRLAERASKAALRADPQGVEAGVRRAPRRRGLRVAPSEVLGLMRWTLEVPAEQSHRLFTAVDELAQEYLSADRLAHGSGGDGETRERRSVEAARLDALSDLAMASVHVETVVELVVPVDAGAATTVTRPDPRAAAAALFSTPGSATVSTTCPTVAVDEVLVDLVMGNVTHATLAAGELERSHGLRCGSWLESAMNPFLTTRPPPVSRAAVSPESTESQVPPKQPVPAMPSGSSEPPEPPGSSGLPEAPEPTGDRVWFVEGLVEAPGATALLPEQVVALLGDPDTAVLVRSDRPGAADGTSRQRRRHRPGKQLAARVRARDRHCRFPGCSVPAARCQLDHVVPHPSGQTAEHNLHCLCPAHHGFKHHAGWRLTMDADGTCTWTAPSGRRHTTVPGSRRDSAA